MSVPMKQNLFALLLACLSLFQVGGCANKDVVIKKEAAAQVTIDLASQTLTLPDGSSYTFPIDGFSKTCLLQGIDELGYLLTLENRIAAYEIDHNAMIII